MLINLSPLYMLVTLNITSFQISGRLTFWNSDGAKIGFDPTEDITRMSRDVLFFADKFGLVKMPVDLVTAELGPTGLIAEAMRYGTAFLYGRKAE